MIRKTGFMGVVILLAVMVAWNPLFSQESKRGCCIAGEYEGKNQDQASATCIKPGSGIFTMIIFQEKGCGEKIWGKIISDDGHVSKFKGTVKPSTTKDCCELYGVGREASEKRNQLSTHVQPPVETVKFKGLICRVQGKWYIQNGTYKSSSGCSGVFKIKQK